MEEKKLFIYDIYSGEYSISVFMETDCEIEKFRDEVYYFICNNYNDKDSVDDFAKRLIEKGYFARVLRSDDKVEWWGVLQ